MMEKLFNDFMRLKNGMQSLARIVQNEGVEISEEDLIEWNTIACKYQRELDELIAEVNDLYK